MGHRFNQLVAKNAQNRDFRIYLRTYKSYQAFRKFLDEYPRFIHSSLSYKQLKENGGKFRKWFETQDSLPITDYTSRSFWKVTLTEPVIDAIVGVSGLSVQETDDDEDSSQSESEQDQIHFFFA